MKKIGPRHRRLFLPSLFYIVLAWLGLAGLSDALVEWRAWFEQGVMQHWRSTKEWIIAILLWWLPFRFSSWCIDYLVVGTIVIRTSDLPRWGEGWSLKREQALNQYGYVPTIWKIDWFLSHVFLPHRFLATMVLLVIWPVFLFFVGFEALRGEAFAPEIKMAADERRRRMLAWLARIFWCFIGFIPFLFVCSTVLYEHG